MKNKLQENGSKQQSIVNEPQHNSSNKENYSKVKTIEGTPFAIIETDENQYRILFGKWAINDTVYKTQEEAINFIDSFPVMTIINLIGIYVEFTKNQNNE